ncbi:hypothetical protein [Chitinimonas lacunae]|uniref:Uncharacterized protein n=1 Tax=Chitinimonas lacunae TaxID=1963018 RepID=A0ABV8MKI2_9NEIS
MQDFIVSGKTGEVYAEVDIFEDDSMAHFYGGEILDYRFPAELANLVAAYDEAVNTMTLGTLDELESKIYAYDLRLKEMGCKIFDLYIEDKELVTFFTKYPSGDGFLDDYPGK